jgi:DNA-binding winged helix-turn-helix (wHTH) protein
MTTSSARPAPYRENPPPHGANRSRPAAAGAMLEFGRFRILLRRRQLVADGMPIALGTRALDLLLVLLEANGSLVTKEELMSRVWPGIVVAKESLKVQISALREALGEDRDFIRTEFRRGYRFTAAVRSILASGACQRPTRRRCTPNQRVVPPMDCSAAFAHGWCVPRSLSRFDLAPTEGATSRQFLKAGACLKEDLPMKSLSFTISAMAISGWLTSTPYRPRAWDGAAPAAARGQPQPVAVGTDRQLNS